MFLQLNFRVDVIGIIFGEVCNLVFKRGAFRLIVLFIAGNNFRLLISCLRAFNFGNLIEVLHTCIELEIRYTFFTVFGIARVLLGLSFCFFGGFFAGFFGFLFGL